MADTDEEKTEDATDTRREEFRKRGQVAQTRELSSVLVLLGSALLMWGMGRFFLQQVCEILTASLGPFAIEAARSTDFLPATLFITKRALMVLAPLVGILALMSVASTVLQTGLIHNEEAFNWDINKINPLSGLKRLFSFKALIEGAKSILKIILVFAVVWSMVKDQIRQIPLLGGYDIAQLITYAGGITLRLLTGVGIFMGLLAAADYFLQWFDLEKQMRMSKQEIKEEHKSREGDPMIKARIRRIQREMASKRMMGDVPKADVIITNPTHIAIAIQYDPETMAAPKMIAKGAGAIAERIKAIARENNIPIMENKPLARAMFKTMKIGQTIPRELFTAVAQVISYIYKLRRKVMR